MASPSTIPVILLAECNVFPHSLLPLNIFEPRYRAMLAHALQAERFIAVATMRTTEDDEWDERDENIYPFSCTGLVRACVAQPDGTSRLILQGIERIQFTGWVQRDPFRIASCEVVPSEVKDRNVARDLALEALARARAAVPPDSPLAGHFTKDCGYLDDPSAVADVIGYNFLKRVADRQPLLEMRCVEDRLEYILARMPEASPAAE